MEDTYVLENNLTDEMLTAFKTAMEPSRLLMTYYSCAIMEIETKFKVLNRQFSLEQEHNPIETIKTRLKSVESIIEKMRSKNLPLTVEAVEENLHDVAGIRVICPFIQDIYLLVDCLLKQDDVFLIEKKDYIQNPKDNGYRSLHLIVETPIFLKDEKRMMKVEVQLRTIAMDFWASLEHRMRYKKELNPKLTDYLFRELKECADTSAQLDKRMEHVKDVIEMNEVL
jgi:putative GTP pyrophosphokinase